MNSTRIVSLQFKKVVVQDPVEVEHGVGANWSRDFGFDAVFGSDGTSTSEQQEDVYRGLGIPVLAHAWQGLNSSIFAYGQTGSGKTFSMLGGLVPGAEIGASPERGLIPRICCGLFDAADAHRHAYETVIEASYMEIYNEHVRDLLLPTGKALRVREHPRDGACVPDLTLVRVCSREELVALLQVGSKSRATAATRGNARSSRSHAVFTLSVVRRKRQAPQGRGDVGPPPGGAPSTDAPVPSEDRWWEDVPESTLASSAKATVRLVDLAGSERVAVTGTDGARLREAKSINRSLATLCDVIEALAANSRVSSSRKTFVPYRNSTLTWLLKESLGGNAFATMLATVSPSDAHYEETLATLKYAARARKVRAKASVNVCEDLEEDRDASVRSPTSMLSDPMASSDAGAGLPPDASLGSPHQSRFEHDVAEHQSVLSAASTTTPTWPRLTNLNPDPCYAGRSSVRLHDGATVIGAAPDVGVAIVGNGVIARHAVVCSSASNDVVVLCALPGAETHVNGKLVVADGEGGDGVSAATVLRHGARVVFARTLAFRFEAYFDEALQARDATNEWHSAQREVAASNDLHSPAPLRRAPPRDPEPQGLSRPAPRALDRHVRSRRLPHLDDDDDDDGGGGGDDDDDDSSLEPRIDSPPPMPPPSPRDTATTRGSAAAADSVDAPPTSPFRQISRFVELASPGGDPHPGDAGESPRKQDPPRPLYEPIFDPSTFCADDAENNPDSPSPANNATSSLAHMKRKVELAQAQLDAILGTAPPYSMA